MAGGSGVLFLRPVNIEGPRGHAPLSPEPTSQVNTAWLGILQCSSCVLFTSGVPAGQQP